MKAMTLNLKGIGGSLGEFRDDLVINWRLMLLFLLFLSGLFMGVSVYNNCNDIFASQMKTMLEKLPEISFGNTFGFLIITAIIPLIIAFLSSFSALGIPFVMIAPAVYGSLISFIGAYLYNVHRIDGAVFAIITVFPAAIIISLMQLIGCNESLILSGIIAQNTFSAKRESRGELKEFFIRYLVIAVVIIVITAVQALCLSGFGSALLF